MRENMPLLLSNPRAPPVISRKKLAELLLDTLKKVPPRPNYQHPRDNACAHKFSLKFTQLKHALHESLKIEKSSSDFLNFAVYRTL